MIDFKAYQCEGIKDVEAEASVFHRQDIEREIFDIV